MTYDHNRGISEIAYNPLGMSLRTDIKSPVAEARNQYTYTASGAELRTVSSWNSNYSSNPVIGSTVNANALNQQKTIDYVGNIKYENGVVKKILTNNGYYENNNCYFYLRDHLGSNVESNINMKILTFLRIIALAECLFGFVLIANEIVCLVNLPTEQDANSQFGGLVEWFKYKESCYNFIYLYSLLIITGISFWLNRKLYWGLTQVLLITLFFVIIMNLWFSGLSYLWIGICLKILTLIAFIYLEIKMYHSLFLQTMGISKKAKWLFFMCGGLSCILWFLLYL